METVLIKSNLNMNCICTIREINVALSSMEDELQSRFGLCVNESLLICSLDSTEKKASEIAEILGLKVSNTSKVLKLAESKGLINRRVNPMDKRYKFFCLSLKGEELKLRIEKENINIPNLLKPIFNCNTNN